MVRLALSFVVTRAFDFDFRISMAHYWFWPPTASLEVVYGIYDMDLELLNLVADGLWRSSVLPALENGLFGNLDSSDPFFWLRSAPSVQRDCAEYLPGNIIGADYWIGQQGSKRVEIALQRRP